MTEQNTIKVEFKITELLHMYDQLIIAEDTNQNDTEMKKICQYLQNKILTQLPDYTESPDYYKSILP